MLFQVAGYVSSDGVSRYGDIVETNIHTASHIVALIT